MFTRDRRAGPSTGAHWEVPLPRKHGLASTKEAGHQPAWAWLGRPRRAWWPRPWWPQRSRVRAGPSESGVLVHPRPDPTWGLKGSSSPHTCLLSVPLTPVLPQKAGCLWAPVTVSPASSQGSGTQQVLSERLCVWERSWCAPLSLGSRTMGGSVEAAGRGRPSTWHLVGPLCLLGQTRLPAAHSRSQLSSTFWASGCTLELTGESVYVMEIGTHHKPGICPRRTGC